MLHHLTAQFDADLVNVTFEIVCSHEVAVQFGDLDRFNFKLIEHLLPVVPMLV